MNSDQHSSYVVFIHSLQYLKTLNHLPVHQQRERMTLGLLEACYPEGKLSRHLQFISPTVATRTQLEIFHSRDYLGAIYELTAEAFGLVDDAYVFPGLVGYCCYVAGATLTAVDTLLHLLKTRSGPLAAINLGGGRHHAMRSQASGFCYVNDVVLGVQRLISRGIKRVLVVDIDVHHGDGTQEAFYYSEKVTTVSFHLKEPGFFPGTGADTEIGAGRGKYNNVNTSLQRGVTDEQFHELFQRVVNKAVDAVKPQILVLVCGVDTLAQDPLGGFDLPSDGICDCVGSVMALHLPVLVFGSGDYSGADACKTFAAVVATVFGQRHSIPREIPEHKFYEQYLPEVQFATKSVIRHRNLNTGESLLKTRDRAISTLERFAVAQQNRTRHTAQKRTREN